MVPSRQSLGELLSRCGVGLPPARLDALWAYHRMLRAANAELNLTRIHNFENMVLKHYVDSLLVLRSRSCRRPGSTWGRGRACRASRWRSRGPITR